ncbi:hypothetical protein [Paraburkholderia youngii]|uniref:hypothetical protein n=1 Tax=Paraburkholderia youngii TaxID=2782701 RepID=UPI003D253E40
MHSPVSLKPINKLLIAAYAREGVRAGPASGPDLTVSAFGFWTAKLALEYGTPFVVAPVSQTTREIPAHMHLRWVIERVKKILDVDDWTAQKLAAITMDVVRQSGLRVDMQAVLFDERLEKSRAKILKALHDPDFPPAQASVAIGAGLLPWPETSLAALLELIGQDFTFAEVVSRNPTYLWNGVPRDLSEVDSAHLDWVDLRDGKPVAAELGLGLCLVQPYDGVGRTPSQNYHLFSPILHYRAAQPTWHTSGIVSTSYRETDRVARGGRSLADMIGGPVTSLPRVHVCPACMAVYAERPGATPHRCKVGGPNARDLVKKLRARFGTGRTAFTAKDLLADAGPPLDRNGVAVTPEALEDFLHAYRGSLGLRAFDGTWNLMRNPAIKLERSAAADASETRPGA